MDFDINIPVKVVSGRGCVRANAEFFDRFGAKAVIVTGGKGARLSGALDDVLAALNSRGIRHDIYDKVTENPLLSSCAQAGRLAREGGADFIIGIGGGSALDAAKAAAVFATNENLSGRDIYTAGDRNRALPIIAIGTTAGTGSEVGRVSVLTDDESGRKKSISPDDCFPALTFADPKYTESMPFSVTCSTALDALSHALEGYFSVKCGDIPSLFAEKAVSLIYSGLKKLGETKSLPSSDERDKLYYGSLYAGITLSYCGTAFPHPLGYVLTENYGVPHGFACAEFLPAFLERAGEHCPEKMKRIEDAAGESATKICETIKKLTVIPEISMTAVQIDMYSKRWDNAPKNFVFTPGGYTKYEAQKLLTELFGKVE